MRYKLQIQRAEIEERVRARFSMVIPILRGMLNSTAAHILDQVGGREGVTLEVFARIYIERDGDYGICFEYAVHQAIQQRHPSIHPLISGVLEDFCGIKNDAESILFGIEKNGAARVIETARDSLTDASRVLVGKKGKPPYLKSRLDEIASAFHSVKHRAKLPQSIRGLWKADLFIGSPASEQWVGTTLKTNRAHFESAPGLRLGLYPDERRGQGPSVENELIMCPLPYSGAFMELFGASFAIVKQIISAKGKLPSRAALVYDDDMIVAQWLVDRAHFPVTEILAVLEPLGQPGFVEDKDALDVGRELGGTSQVATQAPTESGGTGEETEAAAPIPKVID
jgi:hypothetical protein